jgi:hypothetical protein
VARRASDLPKPVVFIDDGLGDAERVRALEGWFARLDEEPVIDVAVRAADTLAELRATEDQ